MTKLPLHVAALLDRLPDKRSTRLTGQMNIENLSDRTYYLPSGGGAEIAPGRPRAVTASIRAEF